MSKGRLPKDDDIRAGHRPAVGEGEPKELEIVPAELEQARPPADLAPLAAEVWTICVTDMATLGQLREPDLLQIRNYAVEVAIAIECEASIREFGAMMKEPVLAWDDQTQEHVLVGHKLKKNPACQLHREASNAVRLMANDLGLTPIARIRGNLMAAVTTSIAFSIKEGVERRVANQEKADRAAARRRRAPAKTKPAVKPRTPAKPKPAAPKPKTTTRSRKPAPKKAK